MLESEVLNETDLELKRRVTLFLMQRSVQALRLIRVAAKNGTVILSGTVKTFYERQLCLCCCQRVAGVLHLIDETEVAA